MRMRTGATFLLTTLVTGTLGLSPSLAAAQQSGQAIVGSGTNLIAIDLTTGAQTTLPIDSSNLIGIADLTEEASGDLAITDIAGVFRVGVPSGTTTAVTGAFAGTGAIATSPTGDLLVTGADDITGAGTVFSVDPVSGTRVDVVDPVAGTLTSQTGGVSADATNRLLVSYPTLFEFDGSIPTIYSQIATVAPGSSTPISLLDSRDPGVTNNPSFAKMAFDGNETLAVSTLFEEIYVVNANSGASSRIANDGLLTDIRGLTFASNGDILALDAASGIVRVTNPGGVQTAVPNSVVPNASGIILYAPEPGFAAGLALGLLLLQFTAASTSRPTMRKASHG